MVKEKKMNKGKNIMIISLIILVVLLIILVFDSFNKFDELKELHKTEINSIETEMDSLKQLQEEKIASMSAIDYTPTIIEVKKLIKNNKIENKEYDDETFNCVEFTNNLVRAFRNEKIYSCATELWFEEGGAHAIVAIETEENGVIYIEPQDDTIIYSLKVGDDYCDKVNWDCDWEITHIKSCYF